MSRGFSRTDRIGDLIQRELSYLIQHKMNDPRVGMVTLSEVVVSKDLSHAKIYVNTMHEAEQTVDTLNKAAGFLRQALAQRIELRTTPSLKFFYDDALERANKIEKLLNNVRDQDDES